ncbi:MAG: RecX family transcriptional regulator [Bacilli bacterium]|nr:RecX family transcriptional regulator [Bacilli bacterium]
MMTKSISSLKIQDLEFQDTNVKITFLIGDKLEVKVLPLEVFLLHPVINHQTITEQEYRLIQDNEQEVAAYNYAVKLLSKQNYASTTLKEKLNKKYPSKITNKVITKLKHLHFIDDNQYINEYFDSKIKKANSSAKIAYELEQLGFSNVPEAILTKYQAMEGEYALIFAKKYLKLNSKKTKQQQKLALYRQLLARGYDNSLIETIFRTLNLGEISV